MGEVLRRLGKLLRLCWKPLLLFELLYKLAAVAVLFAFGGLAFRAATEWGGFNYLTLENLPRFLRHPLVIAALLLFLLLSALLALPDVGASVYAFWRAEEGFRPRFHHFLSVVAGGLRRVFRQREWRLLLYCLLQIPTLSLGVCFSLLFSTRLSGTLVAVFTQRPWLLLCLLPLFLLSLFSVRRLYLPHYCFLAGQSYGPARRSDKALRGFRGREFGMLLLLQVLLALGSLLLLLLGLTGAMLLGALVERGFWLRWLSSTVVSFLLLFVFTLVSALSLPLRYALVSALFARRLEENGLPPPVGPKPPRELGERGEKRLHRAFVALGCLGGAALLFFGYLLGEGRINPSVEHLRETEVTAHRGASALAPENTMAAFRLAEELGADWIELDVQQSADGRLFVQHDSNFARTTGLHANVWELEWPEIAALDAGSRFSAAFRGEPIPLLEEVLDYARESGLRLNIELKPTGREREMERCVAELIYQYEMEENCVISSQVYGVLERVKAVAPELRTVYVLGLAYGDLLRMTAADGFSVQAASVSRDLVRRLHTAGKEIWVWTVNSPNAIDRMLGRGVDNVITDDIELAQQRVSESRYSSWVREYLAAFK